MQIQLSQKERMLLEDQKNHEQICIQKYTNYANQTQCPQLKQIFTNNAQMERTHLDTINQLLSGKLPQMNQQQNQNSGQNMGSQNTGNSMNNMNNTQQFTGTNKDADMCTDMLMTEKYVSGTYDTTIFEFSNPQIRDILNHIQKEEQKHGEAIFKYMESNGMYRVQ
ncbi:spore coat protein [Lutispora thermophila]|mgnify:CR=1 FL=1|uniref:Spore coat protein CotF n=1 Tax=Lutispora thermophila DSM 19022 TaxID=1122184 RepID=A0A1M6E5D9_9FIRM|nr:spore coat protein [Lutispora thermophila]SHI80613.1 Spore coat protein CotF [Lutispora thermophila DSM 19022]